MSDESAGVAAAVARCKRALDRQAVMAIVGLAVVAAFFVIHPGDYPRTIAGVAAILPWFLGLSVLIVAANRWTLSQQVKAIRATAGPAAPKKT